PPMLDSRARATDGNPQACPYVRWLRLSVLAATAAMALLLATTPRVCFAASAESASDPCDPQNHSYASDWGDQERRIWDQLCYGQAVDLSTYPGTDSQNAIQRVVPAKFLHALIFEEAYRDALASRGLRIADADFRELVNLQDAHITFALEIT